MNWDWLPWRSSSQNSSEDSTYEEEVIERCDHDFEQSAELLPRPRFDEAEIEDGYLVLPRYEKVEEFCQKCGEPGMNGEAHPYSEPGEYRGFNGTWTRVAQRMAFEPEFLLDPDLSVSDAVVEPVEADADFVAAEDGEVEAVEEDDGSGRIIVNEDEYKPETSL